MAITTESKTVAPTRPTPTEYAAQVSDATESMIRKRRNEYLVAPATKLIATLPPGMKRPTKITSTPRLSSSCLAHSSVRRGAGRRIQRNRSVPMARPIR